MKQLLEVAMDCAKRRGIEYADIRIISKRTQNLQVKNGRMGSTDDVADAGFGVRILYRGGWGFSSSYQVSHKEILRVTEEAIRIAQVSSREAGDRVRLSPETVVEDQWQSPFFLNPFKVPLSEKMDLLFEVDRILRKDRRIKSAESAMQFTEENKWLATSEGTRIHQVFVKSGAGYAATAVSKEESQTRSFPNSHGGQQATAGYELIQEMGLVEHAAQTRDEAIALLSAKPCPKESTDLILDGSQIALQIHESCGHPSELDRVLGLEANYAGTSFLSVDKMNHFRYGSKIVDLIADTTMPTGLATCAYDDDGVRAQRWFIVRDGILQGYMTNREMAHVWGGQSRGCCRAESWTKIPMIRISNLSLMPRQGSLEDIVRDTKKGVLFETNRCWSIDSVRLNFQFGCEIGWEIRNGKRGRLLKNPSYQGMTPEFWGSCDAIAGPSEWRLWGVGNCGKGQPSQTFGMSHGAAPARFRKCQIGIF